MHSWTGFSLTIPLFKLFPGLPSGIFFSSTAFLGGIFFFLGADAYVRAWEKTRRKVGGENWREAEWEKTGITEKKEAGGSLVGGVMQWRGGEMTVQPTLCCSPGPCPLGGRGRAQSPVGKIELQATPNFLPRCRSSPLPNLASVFGSFARAWPKAESASSRPAGRHLGTWLLVSTPLSLLLNYSQIPFTKSYTGLVPLPAVLSRLVLLRFQPISPFLVSMIPSHLTPT